MTEEIRVDPIELQIRHVRELQVPSLPAEGFSSPQSTFLLLQSHEVTLAELKQRRDESTKNQDVINELRQQREELRIELAKLQARVKLSWAEIVLSYVGGFAISIMVADIKNPAGWGLLIVSVVLVLVFRIEEIQAAFTQMNSNRRRDANH